MGDQGRGGFIVVLSIFFLLSRSASIPRWQCRRSVRRSLLFQSTPPRVKDDSPSLSLISFTFEGVVERDFSVGGVQV